jgi:hypothetical protein
MIDLAKLPGSQSPDLPAPKRARDLKIEKLKPKEYGPDECEPIGHIRIGQSDWRGWSGHPHTFSEVTFQHELGRRR